ncbi:MAG: Na+/H+ antiporter NhaA [Actinomycetota bacterium]|jgi:NhaA family Na+:H+ antiporter
MLNFLKVERNAAALLLLFATLGLVLANTSAAPFIDQLAHTPLDIAPLGIHLYLSAWLGEFFMGGFFLLIGLELKRELHSGAFRDRRALTIPTLAALFGALVPAAIFLILVPANTDAAAGWPIPMATDVTFALAIFAVFAKAMPPSARTFLLSFAVIDDIIAILVIAIFLGTGFNAMFLLAAAFSAAAFWFVSRGTSKTSIALSVLLAIVAWYFMLQSGVQPAVIGVVLGLLVPVAKLEKLEHAVHPWVSLVVLPIFAFFAAAVSLQGGIALASAMTIALLLRPLGKVIGITLGVSVAKLLVKNSGFKEMSLGDFARVATLGGIGFTVALLISGSVFAKQPELASQATIATLIAMVASMIIGAIALSTKKKA